MRRIATLLALALAAPSPLLADAVGDALTAAQSAYAAGDLGGTAARLTEAGRALATLQQQRLAAFLPEAPTGWTREALPPQTDGPALALGMLGVLGSTAEARYSAPDGGSFTLTLAADNPLAISMGAMLANPRMMAFMGRVLRVNGLDMLAQDDSLVGLAGLRVLVQASGMKPEAMRPVLDGIDFAGLATFDR